MCIMHLHNSIMAFGMLLFCNMITIVNMFIWHVDYDVTYHGNDKIPWYM